MIQIFHESEIVLKTELNFLNIQDARTYAC